jgi:UDP-glucuronate decarboxylase
MTALRTAADVVEDDLERIAQRTSDELRKLDGTSVLLLGGAGFLGYYLTQSIVHWNRRHAREPIELAVVDNWVRGVPAWMEAIRSAPGVRVVTGDVTAPLPDEVGTPDWVIHAASIASPIFYRQHPLETMDANVGGLRRLLDRAVDAAAAGHPLQGMLYFSTSEIYGDPPPEQIPTGEDFRGNVSCTGPRACYDESKRYGETLCTVFAQVHGVPVRIARPFNNYGPGLKITDRRVLPDFARDILAERDIVMLSSGTPTRTFCYISDAVSGYLKVLVRGTDGEAYNIGTDEPEISVAELAERVTSIAREEFQYRGHIIKGSSDDDDYLVDNPNRRCPDITKARRELDFAPVIDIDDGLRRSLIWYRDNSSAEDR